MGQHPTTAPGAFVGRFACEVVLCKPGEHQRIAVKLVDDRGIESLKVMKVT